MLVERNTGTNTIKYTATMICPQSSLMEHKNGINVVNYTETITYLQSFTPMEHKNGGTMANDTVTITFPQSSLMMGHSYGIDMVYLLDGSITNVIYILFFLYKIDPSLFISMLQ